MRQTLRTKRFRDHECTKSYEQNGFVRQTLLQRANGISFCLDTKNLTNGTSFCLDDELDKWDLFLRASTTRTPRRYVRNGLASMHAPDVTYEAVWYFCLRQTLRTKRFGIHACVRRYVRSGLASMFANLICVKTSANKICV